MALGAAILADSYGLFYWLLILLAVAAGFVWFWQLVADFRNCWQPLLVCVVTGFIAHHVGVSADEFRATATAAGTGLEPGDGLGLFLLLFGGVAVIVTPFALLLSGSGSKKNGQ